MKFKLIVSLILAFLAFVFITQNTETVQVKVFLWSVEMSLVLLVFIMLGAGVIIGWFLNSYVRFASHRQKNKLQEHAGTKKTPVESDVLTEKQVEKEQP